MNHIVLLTTYNRLSLLQQCLESLFDTLESKTPIFIINDGSRKDTRDYIRKCFDAGAISHFIDSHVNSGITPAINTGITYILDFIRFLNADRRSRYNPWISYIQDDMVFTKKNWPSYCIEKYEQVKTINHIDFMTGFDFSYEFDENNHPRIDSDIKIDGIHFRRSMSGQHIMGLATTWKERIPIPTYRIDESSGHEIVRGHPHNGLGSCVDWWITRDSKPSKTMVIEDIAKYDGKKKSTWQVY